ncbi:aconitate hydratase [Marinobacterium nitratireducens]|uniref:Aconitate hydratase n=1 Tax=Marinobacterium nitratireducens TaxID=518897 RepID=A0A917ZG43_9GAMM|nr:aconitate hydratase AcnA [Marinobacterium nitratireducens]GGO82375.1 aconitate hydratase [Marinobacterium nitratireducens]
MHDSFDALDTFEVAGREYRLYRLDALEHLYDIERLPYAMKILLENLLRCEDGVTVRREDIDALCRWDPDYDPTVQIAFTPARVVLQDFTGVPAVVDLAAMRDAMRELGGDPELINPQEPVDLVIDHSVMVDHYGSREALDLNTRIEFERNAERYKFLRWGQKAFANFRVVPPGTGIVHQVNLEYLASVVTARETEGEPPLVYPDTLVGTDSHTTMINGLGVLGWGVGGIEAEAAMLGQPVTMLLPQVVGFRLEGRLSEGATATDLVLTVTQMLRRHGVVGKFVEFFGDGLDELPLADRATIANMAPEYGATCGIFPIDAETLRYLEQTGRSEEQRALVEAYARRQGLWRESGARVAEYSDILELDLSQVVPSLAGPRRPQDRVPLADSKRSFLAALRQERGQGDAAAVLHNGGEAFELDGEQHMLRDGDVVIAAITSCTNTSNPAVMLAAGLVAQKAVALGLKTRPWVKTSLAPGSQVVTAYLERSGLLEPLAALGFNLVGYGCTTCIGNSGPLRAPIGEAIRKGSLVVGSVLSGNRNFEGRIHPDVRLNYLASPPLVVAFALAGTLAFDPYVDPIGRDGQGRDVYLKDLWPRQQEVQALMARCIDSEMYRSRYAEVFTGPEFWRQLPLPDGKTYDWPESSYIRHPPYFEGMGKQPQPLQPIAAARCLVKVGDSITTDHISPAGSIKPDSPAGVYLQEQGVEPGDFNSYGSRRGNHEVMMRGTFANVRLRNELAPGTEGSWTTHYPSGERLSIFDAAMRYRDEQVPLVVLAGEEYGTGSSRDWAAKGTRLLGVGAVIARSFERIHRSNLVGFGVLPLQFLDGESAESLGLSGEESFDLGTLDDQPDELEVTVTAPDGGKTAFRVKVRIDTPVEWDYYRHGGILHYVLRQLASGTAAVDE